MNILIVEDNQKLAENIATVLKHENYVTEISLTGENGLYKASTNTYDLIILDLNLPDTDGIEICKKLRAKEITTPVLMLTARIDLDSKVTGLDSGADDYLCKPFLMDELLARLRALLRRNADDKSSTIQINKEVKLDITAKKVQKNGKDIALSPTEIRILEFLASNRNEAKKTMEIYESVWGSQNTDAMFSDALKVHIARLRKKLGADIIKTVSGFGYIIE